MNKEDIINLTVHELQDKIANKELKITDITSAYLDRIDEKEKRLGQALIRLRQDVCNQYRGKKLGEIKNEQKWSSKKLHI